MTTVTAVRHDHLSDAVWRQLTGRLVIDARDKGVALDEHDAERAMGELVNVYLPVVDKHPGLSPSKIVDLAWHTFINHTRTYERYCHERYGRFIHHAPMALDRDAAGDAEPVYALDFMREHGITYDAGLWSSANGAPCKNHCSAPTTDPTTAMIDTPTGPAQCQ